MGHVIALNNFAEPRLRLYRTGFGVLCALVVMFLFSCAGAPPNRNISKSDTHYKLGLSHTSKGELNDAYVEFQKAITLNPEHKEALDSLGYVSARFQKYDEAESYYKRAIAIDPNYSETMNNLGVLYLETEKWDDAIMYFEMALNNPVYRTPARAYSNLGYAYIQKEDYESAQDAIDVALTRSPEYPFAIYAQGLIYVKTHDDISAIEEFLKVISLLPNYVEAHWEIANAYVRTGERDKAEGHFKVVADTGKKDIAQEALEYLRLLNK